MGSHWGVSEEPLRVGHPKCMRIVGDLLES